MNERRLAVVQAFADHVLAKGHDRWSGHETPLLVDGVNARSGEPVIWQYDGNACVVHNLASQQNLFRVLAGLTNLTGEACYRRAATDAIGYHFENLLSPCGKLRWGGHQFIDLSTLEPVGPGLDFHEFKCSYPFYQLMWDVDAGRTAGFIRALWAGHVMDWRRLDMNRHAAYRDTPAPGSELWNQRFDDPAPFFEGDGLTFRNCGSDLIYAAAILYRLGAEEGALTWARRLAGMYVKARHPETGLGHYQYSKPRRCQEPPADGPLTGPLTYSGYGDRLENQYGRSGSSDPNDAFYNPIKDKLAHDGKRVAREGWNWWLGRPGEGNETLARAAFAQLAQGECLGEAGKRFIADIADELEAFARYRYDADRNHFRPMWADGTDLTGLTIPRTGYNGIQGQKYWPMPVSHLYLLAYARAARLSGREYLWTIARNMTRGLGLGDIGATAGANPALSQDAPCGDPEAIFTLIEMYRASPHPDYLDLAQRIADRMLAERFHHGFFLPDPDYVNAKFDAIEPLALLALEAALCGQPDRVPAYVTGQGATSGKHDGMEARATDAKLFWSETATRVKTNTDQG